MSTPASTPDDSLGHLVRLLGQNGRSYSSQELGDLLAGIAAAPEGFEGPAWLELVSTDPVLRQALVTARNELANNDHGVIDVIPPGERATALRKELARQGVDGFLVPRADEHQGEYVPLRAQRLAWLTGFTGSAGMAIVLDDRAAIFIDGRYTLQVTHQVDTELFEPQPLATMSPDKYLTENLSPSKRIGFDPWLHSINEIERLGAACAKAGAELVPLEANPIDMVWHNQPPAPLGPVVPHDIQYAGVAAETKREQLAATLRASQADAAVLTLPESIAWLLNLRGNDVPHVPLPLSFAIVNAGATVDLFIDPRKMTEAALRQIGNKVTVHPQATLGAQLDRLGALSSTVLLDPATAPWGIAARLQASGARVLRDMDPTALPKACKNKVEIAGTQRAHRRDGVALTKFLAWLERMVVGGRLNEIEASDMLEALRRENGLCRDLSFDTISGAGANGAIVHYRATESSKALLRAGSLYLLDSGAQYPDGTTDVTRTIAIGQPSAEMRDRFTRVLKGHIALATARFPVGTTGSQLDALARRPLWQIGLDYEHGTGHGVGSYLSVHEGPQRISKMASTVALRPGMIVSNEPGYYKTGAYGIRIENLVLVREAKTDGGKFLEFETLTLAPIDRNLVEPSLLTQDELAWLNAYHARVLRKLGPRVDAQTKAWLEQATATIA
ncbi:MAG: M24 family metallopeptidase [Rhodospirillales bacterium]